MASLFLSNQTYRIGDTPIFCAFLYGKDGPFKREDIANITVSHLEWRDGNKNGRIITTWFPVAGQDGVFEDIAISRENLYDDPIDIDTDIIKKIQKPDKFREAFTRTSGEAEYNFLYIPLQGHLYYPRNGKYRTTFKVELTNGETDILTFRTIVNDLWYHEDWHGEFDEEPNRDTGEPVLKIYPEDVLTINYGDEIIFLGEIYAKVRVENPEDWTGPEYTGVKLGEMVFPGRNTAWIDADGNDNPLEDNIYPINTEIDEVYLSIFNAVTAQRYLIDEEDRMPIGAEVLLPNVVNHPNAFMDGGLPLQFPYNFKYQFPTTKLPMTGIYRFRFEIQAKERHFEEETVNRIVCTFDIDVNIL